MRICILLLLSVFSWTKVQAEEEKTKDVILQVQLNCPQSEELAKFIADMPEPGQRQASYEEFKESITKTLTSLIELVESEHIYNASWGVSAVEHTGVGQ